MQETLFTVSPFGTSSVIGRTLCIAFAYITYIRIDKIRSIYAEELYNIRIGMGVNADQP